jgi:transcriptional regulator with XRE-family HTH domain
MTSYSDPRRSGAKRRDGSAHADGARRAAREGAPTAAVKRASSSPATEAQSDPGRALGPLMREARKREHLTLQQVAERADLSISYLSQIERNLLTPSVGTLKRIAAALDIPTGQLIAPDAGSSRPIVAVVRRSQRKRVAFPESSVSYELLTPDFRRRASALWVVADPGADSGPAQTHEGEDIAIVLQGALSVEVAGTWYDLKAGDSMCFNSELPHRWCNRGAQLAKAIWISSPPYL